MTMRLSSLRLAIRDETEKGRQMSKEDVNGENSDLMEHCERKCKGMDE